MTNMGSSDQTAIAQAIALLSHYAFDTKGLTPAQLMGQWLENYEASWIRLGVIEALYQGRYKAISVEQILSIWTRRGQTSPHFGRDFERIISRKLPDYFAIESPPLVETLPNLDEKREQWRSTLQKSAIFSGKFTGTAYETHSDSQESEKQGQIPPWHSDRPLLSEKMKHLSQASSVSLEELETEDFSHVWQHPDIERILAILSGDKIPDSSDLATQLQSDSSSDSSEELDLSTERKPDSPKESDLATEGKLDSPEKLDLKSEPAAAESAQGLLSETPDALIKELGDLINSEAKEESLPEASPQDQNPQKFEKELEKEPEKKEQKNKTPTLPNTDLPNPNFYRSTIRVFTPTTKTSSFFRKLAQLKTTSSEETHDWIINLEREGWEQLVEH
ncbi:MAG: hypothetical protein F6K03_05370 [Kamptonema sp. SIO4C4]|nr:hypothetical protein [Kamptonema sp. SIO4C4]